MINVGGKEYKYIMSVAVSEAFSIEEKKIKAGTSSAEYTQLIIATLRQAIFEYYYTRHSIYRWFNGWLADKLAPSVDRMYHAIEPKEIVRLVAEINGVSVDEVKSMVSKKKNQLMNLQKKDFHLKKQISKK